MTIDEAIRHCEEVAERYETQEGCQECAADHRQLAEWLTELKNAKSIIRVCSRVLGFLLECEIESTSTRHEVETLMKNITEFLSGCDDNEA